MSKNSFIFLVCFFFVVFINAVPLHGGCIKAFDDEEQFLMTASSLNTMATITDCSNTDDILHILYIHVTPDPPKKGQKLQIDAAGFLEEEVIQGSYIDVTVKLGIIQLLKKRFDLCEQAESVDKPCPLEKGKQELSVEVDLPREIPPGKYNVEALAYTPDGRRIACLKAVAIFRP